MTSVSGERTVKTPPFIYEAADLRAFNFLITGWWNLILGLIPLAFLVWFFGSIMLETSEVSWPMIALITALTLIVSGPWTWRPILMLRTLRRQGLLVSQSMAITPECLELHSERLDARVRWSAIDKITRVDGRLFIFGSKTSAYIVPRRVFATTEEFEEFAGAADQCWQRHHSL